MASVEQDLELARPLHPQMQAGKTGRRQWCRGATSKMQCLDKGKALHGSKEAILSVLTDKKGYASIYRNVLAGA